MSDSDALPAASGIGQVAFRVGDIDRMVDFYENVIGLETLDREGSIATLGVEGAALLRLEKRPDLEPRRRHETGLFHCAFLFPDRAALGDALARVEEHWQLTGASDHHVSEALYLDDPEGNGVELYCDRPKSEWPVEDDGSVGMDTLPLALGELRDLAGGDDDAPPGVTVGHVHLEVSETDATRRFYVEGLGMNVRQTYGGDAVFLAAGDYHHHVGANTWNGRTEPGTGRGLDWFEVVVPDEATLDAARERLAAAGREPRDLETGIAVADPDGIEVRVRQ